MSITKDKPREDFDLTIAPGDGHDWSMIEKELLENHVTKIHANRSPERIRRNKMLSVLYRLEEYLQTENLRADQLYTIEYFVKEFCKVLGLNKTQFANYLDTDVSNLNKYYKGQRTFNMELAMKFAHFFHTPVDVWLRVQLKNSLIALEQEERQTDKYSKYDYEKLLMA